MERVRELTGGDGTHAVLECVGSRPALEMALGVVRDGGAISRVGLPQYAEGPLGADRQPPHSCWVPLRRRPDRRILSLTRLGGRPILTMTR
jgi:threonine dehydrogenase-like Zn-dependent dehydrogenase